MSSKEKYLPILLFSCVALGIMIGGIINFPKANFKPKNTHQAKLNKLMDFIENEYVDDVNTDSIVDLTVNSILEKLDPHSVYIPKTDQIAESEIMSGNFVGIGINFYMYKDTVAVVNPLPESPAEKAGIKSGDRILYADKSKLFGRNLPSDSLFSKLKGKVGTDVKLTVYRKSTQQKLNITVSRGTIPIKSVEIGFMLTKTTGYIKINRFAEQTYTEFVDALIELQHQGAKNLIIDVRGNGGGFLERATEIADELLKNKDLIVFTKNKKGNTTKVFATENGLFETGKVSLLIDENSASASEVLAGAIQDNDRGIIIGRRSFGKGLVQREIDFEDGSAVRLTTAKYYTPSGRSIQKPYKIGHGEKYSKDFETRFSNGELYEKDKIKVADSLKFKTKKGRIVYGGGGIVPDIFVPLEVTKGDEGLAYLLNSGMVGHFVFEQIDKNRNKFNKMNQEQFSTYFENNYEFVDALKKYLDHLTIDLHINENKSIVKRYLTAEFARQLFGETEYFEIVLKDDPMIKKALE